VRSLAGLERRLMVQCEQSLQERALSFVSPWLDVAMDCGASTRGLDPEERSYTNKSRVKETGILNKLIRGYTAKEFPKTDSGPSPAPSRALRTPPTRVWPRGQRLTTN
jgi:hypothetical protein